MKWTKDPPTEPGHYWFRTLGGMGTSYRPLHIYSVDGKPWVDGRVSRGPADHCVGDWWPEKIEPPEDSE